jgi:hypothetical protein
MRKLFPYIIAFFALILGFALGALWASNMHSFLAWYQSSTSTSTEANISVAVLRNIRSGETNKAVERLEAQLDRAVIDLADICRECPRPDTERMPFEAVARAREYRAQFPRKTQSAVIDSAVAKTFQMADKPNKP